MTGQREKKSPPRPTPRKKKKIHPKWTPPKNDSREVAACKAAGWGSALGPSPGQGREEPGGAEGFWGWGAGWCRGGVVRGLGCAAAPGGAGSPFPRGEGGEKADLIFNRREVYWPLLTRRLGANRKIAAGGARRPRRADKGGGAVRGAVRCGAVRGGAGRDAGRAAGRCGVVRGAQRPPPRSWRRRVPAGPAGRLRAGGGKVLILAPELPSENKNK